MLAGSEGRSFDLGDDRRVAADQRTHLDHPRIEDRIDDRAMPQRLADADLAAVVQDRQPGRRAGAARRSIDFAVGEDRDVALGPPLVLDGLPEDDAVDAREVRLVGVGDLERARPGRGGARAAGRSARGGLAARPGARVSARPSIRRTPHRTPRRGSAGPGVVSIATSRASTNDGTFRNRTASTRPLPSRRAVQASRPDGTSTVTPTSRAPGSVATRPVSIAQVTSAIVPCPHAVE